MLTLYSAAMGAGTPLIKKVLLQRSRMGKEDPARLTERMGIYNKPRPAGPLAWFHAASVGEAQSTLILINALQKQTPFQNILVTTGTVTSAKLMEQRLPPGAFHQFFPVDHPQWTKNFLDHWKPDAILWMESELWPNMLLEIARRKIPVALINARLSEKSAQRWRLARRQIKKLLGGFSLFLAQTEEDAATFRAWDAKNVMVCDNLKYAADPLPCIEKELTNLRDAVKDRPLWLYASTHDGEEDIACRIHAHIKKKIPDLLTVIIPRHPERREAIQAICEKHGVSARLRGSGHSIPQKGDDIYIADTLGELGLFYRLCPVACIGRSFSRDGGGGHNPIEAAQLDCAVLHGPRVQNLARIYEEMDKAGAALCMKDEKDFQARLERLLSDPGKLAALQNRGAYFVREKAKVLETVMNALSQIIERATAA